MKAAIVLEAGRTPVYGDFKEPVTGEGEVRINVAAAALSNVVRSRASGKHYSSSGDLPFVVGIDGVGRLDDGRRDRQSGHVGVGRHEGARETRSR